jgi:hypothetical protein
MSGPSTATCQILPAAHTHLLPDRVLPWASEGWNLADDLRENRRDRRAVVSTTMPTRSPHALNDRRTSARTLAAPPPLAPGSSSAIFAVTIAPTAGDPF